VPETVSASIITLIIRLGLKGIIEEFFSSIYTNNTLSPTVMYMENKGTEGDLTSGSTGNTADLGQGSSGLTPEQEFIKDIREIIEEFEAFNKKAAGNLKIVTDTELKYENIPLVNIAYKALIEAHSGYLTKSYMRRDAWITKFMPFFPEEVQSKLMELESKRDQISRKYFEELDKLDEIKDPKARLQQAFIKTNAYRNALNKEFNLAEQIVNKSLKGTVISKNPEFKVLVNSIYIEVKKIFNNQDGYLKKRIEQELLKKEN